MEKIGLIAGNGRFPLIFAREARDRGVEVVATAHRGETDEALAGVVDALTWIRVGQLGKMIKTFKRAGVDRAVMAGGINKVESLLSLRPDWRGMQLLRRVGGMGDDALLRGLAEELERDGIRIVPSTLFLDRLVATEGRIAGPSLDARATADVGLACRVLETIGPLDVGQAVVVENGVVLAIEAIEGTDAAVRRGGALGRGRAVVVKMAKPGQDMRFDVPAVGPGTVETMAAAGVTTLAVEAGAAIILDKESVVALAEQERISVVGCSRTGDVADD